MGSTPYFIYLLGFGALFVLSLFITLSLNNADAGEARVAADIERRMAKNEQDVAKARLRHCGLFDEEEIELISEYPLPDVMAMIREAQRSEGLID